MEDDNISKNATELVKIYIKNAVAPFESKFKIAARAEVEYKSALINSQIPNGKFCLVAAIEIAMAAGI